MELLLAIILGGLAGWLASVLMHSPSQGVLKDIILGILGSLSGSFIFGLFGQAGVTGFNLYSLAVSVVGAIVLIALGRMLFHTI